jgi:hypothetical protein
MDDSELSFGDIEAWVEDVDEEDVARSFEDILESFTESGK